MVMTDPVTVEQQQTEPPILEPAHFTPDNDPFRVRLNFSPREKVQMLLVLIFIVPVRVFVAFVSLGGFNLD